MTIVGAQLGRLGAAAAAGQEPREAAVVHQTLVLVRSYVKRTSDLNTKVSSIPSSDGFESAGLV
jgi:hypothetical protein